MGFVVVAAWLASAMAGQIQVEARSPVVVAIDGLPAGIAHLHADDVHLLQEGRHRVTIRNFMGSLMAEGHFEVKDGERLVVQYDRVDRTIEEVERIPLTSRPESDSGPETEAAPTPESPDGEAPGDPSPDPDPTLPHPGHVPAPSPAETPADARVSEPPPADPPAPTGSNDDDAVSSLVITGLSDISGTVRIDGTPIPFTTDADGFLASDLTSPLVEAHITDNGILRFHGAVELQPGQHTACHLHYRQTTWTLDCTIDGARVLSR